VKISQPLFVLPLAFVASLALVGCTGTDERLLETGDTLKDSISMQNGQIEVAFPIKHVHCAFPGISF
jgi:hypothetical protein